ncbi:MAG: hypothetical protein LUD15_00625 [Bacteroides sp.]|nr:hypothetical protein [Bacteroides sp.]
MKKKIVCGIGGLVMALSGIAAGENDWRFVPGENLPERTLEFSDGTSVRYRAYKGLYYVTSVVDSAY